MTPIPLSVIHALSQPFARSALRQLARKKFLRFNEFDGAGEDRQEAFASLRQLSEHGLVTEKPAPLEDFNIYVITADGLVMARQIGLIDLAA